VSKAKLGNKHTCKNCETRFFDMNKNPAVCPKCGEELKLIQAARTKLPVADAPAPAKVESPASTPDEAITDESDDSDQPDIDDDFDEDDLTEEDDDALIEDASDLGQDDDDMSEVREHVDEDIVDKG